MKAGEITPPRKRKFFDRKNFEREKPEQAIQRNAQKAKNKKRVTLKQTLKQ